MYKNYAAYVCRKPNLHSIKWLLIMKMMIILLTVSFLQLANASDGQVVNLRAKKTPVKQVLFELSQQSGYDFIYDANLLKGIKELTVTADGVSLKAALERCFEGKSFEFVFKDDKTVVIKPGNTHNKVITLAPVQGDILGKVTDDQGKPMPGVTVKVKGTQNGTTTDGSGSFHLSVNQNSVTLVITSIGYVAAEVQASIGKAVTVSLKTEEDELNEVVVVGYGTQKRSKVTAAISSVPMSEIKDMPVSNVASALQGKIPGVVVQQNSGKPGAGPAIKVRGFGSISAGNNPLVVVDGNIVGSGVFSQLNSADIESIDVLKDASSTAIYGSKGSNGVIMVTTKKGVPGKPEINVDVYQGFQNVTKKIDLLNSQQFAEFAKDAANNAYLDNVPDALITDPNEVRPADYLRYRYPRGEIFDWFNFDDPEKVANLPYNNYQDLIFRNAPIASYQLSVSGGNDNVRYSVGGSYLNQDGVINRSGLDRYALRSNVEINVIPAIKIGFNLNPSYKIEDQVKADGHWADNAVINSALSAIPMAPIYAADGSYSSQAALAAPYNYPGITNPIANINEYHSKLITKNILANLYGEASLLKNFKYRVSANISYDAARSDAFRSSKMPLNQQLPPTQATGSASSDEAVNWLVNQILSFNKSWDGGHDLEVMIGMEATKYDYRILNGSSSSYPNDLVETLNASASGTTSIVSSQRLQNTSASYFARANYSYRDKYLLNFSIRQDGSSIFGANRRWGSFPAGSVGWRVNKESFMENIKSVSDAKLRVSYGLSGNNAFNNNYPSVAGVSSDNYSFNGALANGLAPSSLGNSNLTWEKSQQLDAGLDVGFFNNRLYFTADYYERTTKDLLLSVNVPSITGFTTTTQNIGKMRNRGLEFALNSQNFNNEFSWNTSINFSLNRNKVLALGPTGDPIRSGTGVGETNITMIGQPIGSFYGYKQLGIFMNQQELDSYAHDPTSKPGDVKYEDIKKDNVINADDRTLIGNNQPDFLYSMSNTFGYKNFDLSVSLQGSQGGKILNLSRRFYEQLEGNSNQMAIVNDRWKSESEPGNGKTPRANARPTGNNNAVSTRWVEDGSFLRIQNISLGYKISPNCLNRIKMKQVRFYISCQNLYTWTDYTGYNPEVSNYESALTGGVDYGSYPLARTFTVGINVGF
ncbi:TonB-linked outer membrane protein, SusC/RagA family [bacterium A37T11]|nr:TonB-linked outer membrane protein, SusC/RagA family [bacterium A37T11]